MAPWCPACRSFTETWKKFAGWSDDLEFQVGVIDVTENPGIFNKAYLPTSSISLGVDDHDPPTK